MRISVILAAAVAGSISSSAMAEGRVTDTEFLRASRCKGLAEGLSSDSAAIDAFLKTEGRSRDPFIIQRGEELTAKARREAKRSDHAAKASEELAGACQAYKG